MRWFFISLVYIDLNLFSKVYIIEKRDVRFILFLTFVIGRVR